MASASLPAPSSPSGLPRQSSNLAVGNRLCATSNITRDSPWMPLEPMCSRSSGGQRSEMAVESRRAPSSPNAQPCTLSVRSGSPRSPPMLESASATPVARSRLRLVSAGALAVRAARSAAAPAPSATSLRSMALSATAGEAIAWANAAAPPTPRSADLITSRSSRCALAHIWPRAPAPSAPRPRLLTSRRVSCEDATAPAIF
mmetsp:Transcript_17990/g.46094  ORF Transcript_17990/g.46094 Transcript_17990/m.46094 type:complete len:202 (+) Transcript_17990:445-1050(+)